MTCGEPLLGEDNTTNLCGPKSKTSVWILPEISIAEGTNAWRELEVTTPKSEAAVHGGDIRGCARSYQTCMQVQGGQGWFKLLFASDSLSKSHRQYSIY